MIEEQKPAFKNIDLVLKINVQNLENIKEADINCTISKIKDSNYTLSCQGEKDILYNLQSAVSFIDNNDLLLVNFDENTTSEIIFHHYRLNFKRTSNGISTGAIVAIVLGLNVVLAGIITFIIFRIRSKGKTKQQDYTDSNIIIINNKN